ncbi:MAG: 50S ribosomal protein L10 [Saprospiraceae bacterium]|nr:MAG: 50S ribosomal protein L10 [Bacteroidetes bacterium OLB9]MCO6464376.1 50S ribosomal protein L10 [Saprospiraceae bacterium]MCZ2337189.1 50S ribosomal protein L10 [Chitinophagales bacterium]
MTRTEKGLLIQELRDKFENASYFYVTDASELTVDKINKLRRICFEKGVEMKTVKNTLAIKAMEEYDDSRNFKTIFDAFKGQSTILFSNDGKLPAVIIKEFRGKDERPILKAAYIDSDVFFGDDNLEVLTKLKSKNELIGDVIMLLQSPAKNVVSALKSGGSTLSGLVKALEERG